MCVRENTLQRGRSCVMVCMCVVYNTSPMLLSKAQVVMTAAAVSLFMERHGVGYMTVFMGPTCGGTEADVIRGMPLVVYPRCVRCMCIKCNEDVDVYLRWIKRNMDFWVRRHIALFGYLWCPSLSNMRALHLAVSCGANDPRAELATLCLHASRVQMRYRWHGKRVLEQWFRFVAWRRRAWIRVTFVHRGTFDCLTIIGAMVFAPPRRLIFRH